MISLDQVALGIKIFFFFANIVFRAEFYNKCQNLPGHAVSQLLKFLTHNLCEYGSRVGIRVKKVIISNLVISLVPYLDHGQNFYDSEDGLGTLQIFTVETGTPVKKCKSYNYNVEV